MKIWLDDIRPAPDGWYRTYTVEQTLELLKTKSVQALSLDNDLGNGLKEGYVVVDKLEEWVYFDSTFPIPEIVVHSSNASRKEYMNRVIYKLETIRQQQIAE